MSTKRGKMQHISEYSSTQGIQVTSKFKFQKKCRNYSCRKHFTTKSESIIYCDECIEKMRVDSKRRVCKTCGDPCTKERCRRCYTKQRKGVKLGKRKKEEKKNE